MSPGREGGSLRLSSPGLLQSAARTPLPVPAREHPEFGEPQDSETWGQDRYRQWSQHYLLTLPGTPGSGAVRNGGARRRVPAPALPLACLVALRAWSSRPAAFQRGAALPAPPPAPPPGPPTLAPARSPASPPSTVRCAGCRVRRLRLSLTRLPTAGSELSAAWC